MIIERSAKPKKLKEDMSVYKILDRGDSALWSSYQWFKYIPNMVYTTEIKKSDEGVPFDYLDKELYNVLDLSFSHGVTTLPDHLVFITEGFHSCLNSIRLVSHTNRISSIYKCIIPKGSIIYINGTGCIVSNQIIITNEIV
jgi:hypothetical protein